MLVCCLLSGVGGPSLSGEETLPSEVILKEVPPFFQQQHYCGPAALASVLTYWGYPISQEEIGQSIYLNQAKGTLNLDLTLFARRLGFEATSYPSTLIDLKRHLSQGQPLIAFVNLGSSWFPRWHYLVIVGYDDLREEVISHSGRYAFFRYPYERFCRAWAYTNNWTLVVQPNRTSSLQPVP